MARVKEWRHLRWLVAAMGFRFTLASDAADRTLRSRIAIRLYVLMDPRGVLILCDGLGDHVCLRATWRLQDMPGDMLREQRIDEALAHHWII